MNARGLVWVVVLLSIAAARAEGPIVRVGAGSYTTVLPPGAKGPPETIFRTDRLRGPTPTNDWWSSVAWMPLSERHYPHPLAVQAVPAGLCVFAPGPGIAATKDAIYGFMPTNGDDLTVGLAGVGPFPDARVDGFSDWFVDVRFATGGQALRVSYGHGSPFVYGTTHGASPQVAFRTPPRIWSGDERSCTLGLTVNGKPYALFGPQGSTWSGLKGKTFTSSAPGNAYFSVALLPDATPKSLALFERHAHAHVTGTKVDWSYDPADGTVATRFTFQTMPREGTEEGTLFALYPHQWRHAKELTFLADYPSVRGRMRLAEGRSFQTVMRYPGVLPALPRTPFADPTHMAAFLKEEAARPVPGVGDTYWDGKWLGKHATLVPIAELYGQAELADTLRDRMRQRLEQWFTAVAADAADGRPKTHGLFHYDRTWGTLTGYPASYGSDTELNDHHFHYGYFLKAAAEVARHDPAWAAPERWGGLVRLLVRDVVSANRADPLFPFLRCFDPYAGHSWASGHGKFGDGNNNESSSEAMNAWTGLILWGEATGDRALRDLGAWLYTTEMNAIHDYWFDVHGENFPRSYPASVVTMVWGGKGANGTWFSGKPEHIHGINWLPVQAGSLYLGHYPAYAEKNYQALVKESGTTAWKEWPDILWMYRALTDPADARQLFEAGQALAHLEGGNSRANAYHWITALAELGRVDPTVTADLPTTAVFRQGAKRTYCVWNLGKTARTVTFSDGHRLEAQPGTLTTSTAPARTE